MPLPPGASDQPVARAFRPEVFQNATSYLQSWGAVRFFPRLRFHGDKSSNNAATPSTVSACINPPSTPPSIARACLTQNRDPSSATRTPCTHPLPPPPIARYTQHLSL